MTKSLNQFMTVSQPLVSIILTTHDRANYLPRAVQTVLAQTYPHWELWVIDDGSTDNTKEVIATFSDSRVRYVHQQNLGRSVARNYGLSLAQGEFIAFLDDDDWYFPHKLHKQLLFLQQYPTVGLVGAGTEIVNAAGEKIRDWAAWRDQPHLCLPNCLYACPLPISTVLIRREWLHQLDHWFDPQLTMAEDTDLFLRLLMIGCPMEWLPEVVSAYRQHSQNSQQDGKRYNESYQQVLQKFFGYPQLPPFLKAIEPEVRAYYCLLGGCVAYAQGQIEEAHHHWELALKWDARLGTIRADWLVEVVVGFVRSQGKGGELSLIHSLFDQLPTSLAHLHKKERDALSLWYMGRVFEAAAQGDAPSWSDWVWGMWFGFQRWAWNRGVWVLGGRSGLSWLFSTNSEI